MGDEVELEPESWTTYDAFALESLSDDELMEQFQIQAGSPDTSWLYQQLVILPACQLKNYLVT